MKQRKRHSGWQTAALAMVLCFLLSGCSISGLDARSLMRPPKPTGEKANIYTLLEAKAGRSFTLKYPAEGDYRSAIIQYNLCGDSTQEAMAFYQRGDDDTTVNLLFTEKKNGRWTDIGSFSNAGAQVDRVCFGDLNGDGKDEVIVGWGSSTGAAGSISIYYYQKGKMNEMKLDQTYNGMTVMDFDGDGIKELLTVSIPPDGQQQFTAQLFKLKDASLQVMGSAKLDAGISKLADIKSGKVSKNQPGVMLDCIQTDGKTISEILYWNKTKKTLSTPLYNAQAPQQNVTLRDLSLPCTDINSDQILEFPIVMRLPGYVGSASDDVGSETKWTRFDAASGDYTTVCATISNARDGYRITLPDKWSSNSITTKQDASARTLTVSSFDISKGTAGKPLMVAQVFTQSEWSAKKNTKGFEQVLSDGSLIIAVSCPTPGDSLAVPAAQLKKCFQFITSES
ncbi:MAG: FG-GAP-like repeat-containing protein [Oscillospiraceae bacterium]|nr:FG-GAP-like repeat-containing protein [Oscillospiraceae bacterium]MDD3261676.1 FG-GAP repeat protein [Oscillospiraceae bacterium]